jgi:hypothetical protein
MSTVVLLALLATAPGTFQQNDVPPSTAIATPHVAWAGSLPGGPIKAFFISPIARGRDMAELMQRLSLEPTTVSIDREWDINCWGIGDSYGHDARGDRDDFRTVYGYVEKHLTSDRPFEVLVVPGLNGWSRLTRPSRDAILRRVREGAGLVLIHPFVGDVKGHPFAGDEAEGDARIWELSPLVGVADDFVNERGYWELNEAAVARGRWEAGARHFITDGLPLDLLPSGEAGGRFYKYQAKGEVLIQAGGHPLLAVKSYGKGRVAAFGYVEDGFLPEGVDPVETRVFWDYWEYQYALLARAVLWAAGRESDLSIESVRATPDAGFEMALRTPAPREIVVEATGKSAFGVALRPQNLRRALAAGRSVLSIPAEDIRPESGWSGGRQIVNVVVKDAATGATLNWGAAAFEAPKAGAVSGLRTGAPVYRQGDLMSVVTQAVGGVAGLRMRVTLRDDLERTLAVQEKPTKGETSFYFRLDDFLGREATLIAELADAAGRVIDQRRSKPILVVQGERRRGDYVAYLSFEESRHFLGPTRRALLGAEAIEGGFTWGGAVNNDLGMPRGSFGVYWYDRGPTTPEAMEKAIAEFQRTGDLDSLEYLTKKELFKRTGDTRFLVRKPSLDDPEVLSRLAGIARASARTRAVYDMDYYFVGDEGSLTSYSDSYDFCWGPHTLAHFREWLRSQYGSLDALNAEWRSAFGEWDAVVPSTTAEARRTRNFAPWADHRTYMEVSFANAYRVVRDAVREGDPDGEIALSGTQVTGPYNGCDWHRLDKVVDHFLSYSGGNQWEMHRSFAKPGSLVGFWTGYGSSGVGVQHEIWTAALTGVLHPNLFWSYSVVNPDLSLSKSGRDMGAVFKALRFEGIGRLLMEAERVSDGVAIHYSMPSVHAAGILGLHERGEDDDDAKAKASRFPADRDGWVRALTDLGLSPDFVSSEQVEAGALEAPRQRVFVLPLSLAVSAEEAKALERFAAGGGVVIADAAAGLFDRHVAWRSEAALNALFGITAPPSDRRDPAAAAAKGPVVVTSDGREWGLEAQALDGLATLERDVRASSGRALLRIGDADAVVVRRVGRGWAVYLNVLLDGYPVARAKGDGGQAYRALLARLLEHVDVRPSVQVQDAAGRSLDRTRISRYRFGDSEVVALLRDPVDVEAIRGRDGVTIYEDQALGKVAREELVLRLPRVAFVTDARTGRFLGQTDRVTVSAVTGEAVVLALSPARSKLTIEGPAESARGERVSFRLTSTSRGRGLVRCHVFGPDGAFLHVYARNVMSDGPSTFVLPTALSDPPGAYRIRATDVLTDAEAEATLKLR